MVVLDDYQRVAAGFADFSGLGEVDFVHEHLAGDALRARLAGAEVVVAMRERTPFGAGEFAGLPDLRLLVTTGMANAAIDLQNRTRAFARNGIDPREQRDLDVRFAQLQQRIAYQARDGNNRYGNGWGQGVGGGRDRDRDGVRDSRDGYVDGNRNGVDDRREGFIDNNRNGIDDRREGYPYRR